MRIKIILKSFTVLLKLLFEIYLHANIIKQCFESYMNLLNNLFTNYTY